MASLLNKSAVRERALYFGTLREWKPERVSKGFIEKYEAQCDALLRELVAKHPSKGKTLL